MSWARLIPRAIPGINKASEEIVSKTADSPNNRASSAVPAKGASKENKVHHQYSDLLDLVLKSKYRRNPEATAWVKFIYRDYLQFGCLERWQPSYCTRPRPFHLKTLGQARAKTL